MRCLKQVFTILDIALYPNFNHLFCMLKGLKSTKAERHGKTLKTMLCSEIKQSSEKKKEIENFNVFFSIIVS